MQWLTMKIRRMIILTTLAAVATISENCDGIKTVVEQNKHDWEKILVYPQPGILNYHPQIQEKIDGFFESLNRGNKTHLVVLMERSAKLGKSEFYLRQRKLVEDILRFHTDMRPDHLISSIITFSFKDSDTHFDVTGSDKDMFFRDIWPNVIYEPDKAIGDVDMRFAFTAARDRFEKFGNQNSVTRLLLLLASGEFTDSPDRITREDLQSKKVSIYVVQCGEESDEGRERLRALASKPEMYGTFFQWMNASWVYRPPGIGKCYYPYVLQIFLNVCIINEYIKYFIAFNSFVIIRNTGMATYCSMCGTDWYRNSAKVSAKLIPINLGRSNIIWYIWSKYGAFGLICNVPNQLSLYIAFLLCVQLLVATAMPGVWFIYKHDSL